MSKLKGTETAKQVTITNKKNPNRNVPFKPSSIIMLVALGLLFGIFGVIYLIDDILPTPLKIIDEKDNPNAFIAERAQNYLKSLTDIGPRVAGSYENEVLAVNLLKKEISFIQSLAHPDQKIEVDVQIVSGSYNTQTIKSYENVQNVIVKLHSKSNSEYSLLVNAHFDSVPTSPGGSDDEINCAAMLEILRKLAQSSERFEHNIIFLFNGAEEAGLLGAHGFITQHKWAKEVQALINLEAAAAGGKIMLFQAGPSQPWLVNYYKRVPHPFTQAVAEELFLNGWIPSGTDFIIFKTYGNLVGLDCAFIKDGYRYHSRFDDFSNILGGSYQHVGDNILYLTKVLANAPELSNRDEQESKNTVFYDYLGMFVISYSKPVEIALNCGVSLISTIMVIKSWFDLQLGCSLKSLIYFGMALGAILLSWLISAALIIGTAAIIDAFKFSMSWYGNPWILFGLYVTPTIAFFTGILVLLNYFILKQIQVKPSIHAQTQAHLQRLILTLLLLIGTIAGIRSAYLIMIPILFQTLSFVIIHIVGWHHSDRKWELIYVIGSLIPNFFLMQVSLTFITFFIPICGRIGSFTNSEIQIAFFTFLCTLLITLVYIPLISQVRDPLVFVAVLNGIFLVFVAIVFTFAFPYSGNPESPTPQRYWIYHANRIFRDENNNIYKNDSGFYVVNYDRNAPDSVKDYVEEMNNITSIADDCKISLFCGLPLGSSGTTKAEESTWIPTEQPIFDKHITLNLNSKSVMDSRRTFNVSASGPERMEIYISPKDGVKLTATNLTTELPKGTTWNERPVYIIFYTSGKTSTELPFSLQFEVLQEEIEQTFDIALVGRYLHDKVNVKTPSFEKILKEFPQWTDVTPLLSSYESWVY